MSELCEFKGCINRALGCLRIDKIDQFVYTCGEHGDREFLKYLMSVKEFMKPS